MSIALMSNAWKVELQPISKLVLLALCDWASDNGDSVHPSIETIAKKVGCSSRTVQRIISDLIDGRWIAVVGNKFGGAPGQTRDYLVNIRQLRAAADAFDRREEEERRKKKKRKTDDLSHDEVFGSQTGDTVTPVTNAAETGDIHVTPRVTSTTETGDTGVTQSIIDPSVEPPSILSPAASQPPAVKVVAEPVDEKETALQSACRATWAAYGEAYAALYGAPPLRNAAVNAKIKQFVQRIGYEESPEVARFYVERVRERLVSQRFHDVGLLLSGAEGYRTQWYTNTTMTGTRAQQIDKTQSNADAADEALAILMARRRERSEGGETWR